MLEQPGRDLVDAGRAARAAGLPIRTEHEVLDHELTPALEEVEQPDLAVRAGEAVVLVDAHHRQVPPRGVERVGLPRVLLLADQQLPAGVEPFFAGHDLGQAHGELLG